MVLGAMIMALPAFGEFVVYVGLLLEAGFPTKPPLGTAEIIVLILFGLSISLVAPAFVHWLIRVFFALDEATLKINAMYTAEPAPTMIDIVFASYRHGLPMAVTLSDRKVYVGYPAFVSSSMFSPHGGDLHLTPLISGYRDKDDLTLKFTTPYDTVLKELEEIETEELDGEQFMITIPVREVAHAHLYNPTLQSVFDRHAEVFREVPQQGSGVN